MEIQKVIVGKLDTNCYILSNDNECIVIDPGDDYDRIKKYFGSKKVIGAIVTHNHFDHVGALKYFDSVYDYKNLKEGINNLGSFTFEVIYTPGHTDDSICIYFEKEGLMFDGDFIFKDGIGRTDLGGNLRDMKNSLFKLNRYSKSIKLMPGHGDTTTLGKELIKWI